MDMDDGFVEEEEEEDDEDDEDEFELLPLKPIISIIASSSTPSKYAVVMAIEVFFVQEKD
jgi:hypothetical protein